MVEQISVTAASVSSRRLHYLAEIENITAYKYWVMDETIGKGVTGGTDNGYLSASPVMFFRVLYESKQAFLRCNSQVPEKQGNIYQTIDMILTTISILPCSPIARVGNDSDIEIEVAQCTVEEISSTACWTSLQQSIPSKLYHFIETVVKGTVGSYGLQVAAMKLVVPQIDGYIVRNDIIERRLLNCTLIEGTMDFTEPREKVHALRTGLTIQLAFEHAIGAISLKLCLGVNSETVKFLLLQLESEIAARLGFPWILDAPLRKKRLVIVEGRPHPTESAASEGPYRATKALGIEVVVLDHEGHWLQDHQFAHLRDEFISCDLTVDENLPGRIIQAMRKSSNDIDGIITYSDKLLVATAQVANILRLPADPAVTIERCSDKGKMREITTPELVLSVTGVDDLREQIEALKFPLRYPLIVKPGRGQSSEGVHMVKSEMELFSAVQKDQTMFPGKSYLVEPYISGPEVDANIVLLNGEIIFNETNDDFPSFAERHRTDSSSFAETSTIMPSILPQSELFLLKSVLSEALMKLGLRNGVFHIEARIQNSSMRYEYQQGDLELTKHPYRQSSTPLSEPTIFLIEINARTPGHQESFAVEFTYGIDYYALYTLLAVSPHLSLAYMHGEKNQNTESQRLHALTYPFPPHLQYPTNIVFIPVTRGGTFVSAKPLPKELMSHILSYKILMKTGDIIEDPVATGKWPFIAYFLVISRFVGAEGRRQVRTLGEFVRSAFEVEII